MDQATCGVGGSSCTLFNCMLAQAASLFAVTGGHCLDRIFTDDFKIRMRLGDKRFGIPG